jgi:hypothetical protein
MSIQNRGQVPALYDGVGNNGSKVVTALLGKYAKEIKPIHPSIFPKVTLSSGKFKRYVNTAPYLDVPTKPEGTPYSFDIIMQAGSKDITPVEYGLGTRWTETAEEDDEFDELKKRLKYLMFSMRRTEDKAAAAVLGNGFTTQLTIDGESLFDTAHVLKRGGTAKNRPSADMDLDYTALAQAFTDLGTESKLENGALVAPPMSYKLVVPQALEFQAYETTASMGKPDTAENNVNAVKARRKIEIVVWPDLDAIDSDAWFLIPQDDDSNGLVYLERIPIRQKPMVEDTATGDHLIRIRCRKVWDSVNWQFSYGTTGA